MNSSNYNPVTAWATGNQLGELFLRSLSSPLSVIYSCHIVVDDDNGGDDSYDIVY